MLSLGRYTTRQAPAGEPEPRGLNFAANEALGALLQKHRRAEIDAAYAAYAEHPLSEPDAWGDLESFLDAADRS